MHKKVWKIVLVCSCDTSTLDMSSFLLCNQFHEVLVIVAFMVEVTLFLFSFVMKLSLKQMKACYTSLKCSIVVLNTTNCLSHTLVKHQSWLKLCNRLIFIGHALLHLLCCLVHCFPVTLASDLADLSTVFLLVSKLFPSCFFNLSFSAVAMNTILRIWLHPCPWNWPKNINDENKQLGTDESTNLL